MAVGKAGVARSPLRRSEARFVHGLGDARVGAAGPRAHVGVGLRTALAQALAGEFDAVGVVNDAVEDGVGERGHADQFMPSVDWNLARYDERSFVITVLDDFQEIARLV